jgi:hypothetical protein
MFAAFSEFVSSRPGHGPTDRYLNLLQNGMIIMIQEHMFSSQKRRDIGRELHCAKYFSTYDAFATDPKVL